MFRARRGGYPRGMSDEHELRAFVPACTPDPAPAATHQVGEAVHGTDRQGPGGTQDSVQAATPTRASGTAPPARLLRGGPPRPA